MPSAPHPTDSEASQLTDAAVWGFGKPCTCHHHPGQRVHMCDPHDWLTSDPTQRGLVKVWQRLLFARARRAQWLMGEGRVRSPEPTLAPTVLPW